MQIERDKVVTFHYSLTDSEGSFTESSEREKPVVQLQGHGNIVPGLEKKMLGHQAGDKFQVNVDPMDAYGMRDENAKQRVPIKHLIRPGKKLAVGEIVAVNTDAGPKPVTVLKVGRFNVDVDFNHPLAGKSLIFDIEIVDVREATPEELQHRHAHGPGGHAH